MATANDAVSTAEAALGIANGVKETVVGISGELKVQRKEVQQIGKTTAVLDERTVTIAAQIRDSVAHMGEHIASIVGEVKDLLNVYQETQSVTNTEHTRRIQALETASAEAKVTMRGLKKDIERIELTSQDRHEAYVDTMKLISKQVERNKAYHLKATGIISFIMFVGTVLAMLITIKTLIVPFNVGTPTNNVNSKPNTTISAPAVK